MPGHSSCGLQSEEDLKAMVGLTLSCDIHRIDIFVKCCCLGEGYMICDGEASSSSSVVNCMKGVGQRFAPGVVEFRDALSKYYTHSGFNFDFVKNDKDLVIVHCKRRADLGCLWSDDFKYDWWALTSVSEVVCDFKDYYGTEVSYQQAWMGVEKAMGLVFYDYSSLYCRPVLMLDGTFLKGRHKGCLLAATAKDGNQGILTPERDIAFVTDRHGGLLKALAEVFPFSSHSFCLMHLKTNLKTYLLVKSREFKEYLLTLFSRCAYAPTIELFNELFEEFKGHCGRSVEKFLEDLPNECWCNAYFQGKRYGEMCTNAAKSFNSWIRDERHLFSTSLVDAIRVKLMEQFSRRREVRNKWNHIVCPFAEKKLEEAFNDTKAWIVEKCSDDIYEIQLDHSVMVDIGKRCCSCRLWEIDSFPCKHGFCAIKRSAKDLNCFLDDYYRVSSYCDSYSYSIYPVPSMWKPNVVVDDDVVLPPLYKRPAGRPRTKRMPSKGEIKRIRCSRCGKMGTHNRKICKEALL
ncbi:uncharacterized protein LOC114311482 [Camellia sinensis]|uniref:uncharacterized protein LOC114311482 n=1 Tax=Camellia sinensis TaxID=4442 RepID=UPI00103585F7|nr:uncharacterized protein LOC114311482 [Camellia sinensis]